MSILVIGSIAHRHEQAGLHHTRLRSAFSVFMSRGMEPMADIYKRLRLFFAPQGGANRSRPRACSPRGAASAPGACRYRPQPCTPPDPTCRATPAYRVPSRQQPVSALSACGIVKVCLAASSLRVFVRVPKALEHIDLPKHSIPHADRVGGEAPGGVAWPPARPHRGISMHHAPANAPVVSPRV